MPETFSSEIGDVHRQASDHPSFTDEFEGASDSLIERDRPPQPIDVGRRARRIMFWTFFSLALVGGGGWAVWYWAEPIGEWIASLNSSDDASPVEQPKQPDPVPAEPAPVDPTPVVDPTPTPTPTPTPPVVTPPVPGELPVEPLDRPPSEMPVEPLDQPPAGVASLEVGTTSVHGKVATTTVTSKLAVVDKALEGCWATAAVKPGSKRPATLTLSFTIKWNGHLTATSVSGDAPDEVERCARTALPSSGWPQPRDGGEAKVSRTWALK